MEKRRHKRFSPEVPVTLRCCGKLRPATLQNISRGGVCLKTDTHDIAENSAVELAFDFDKKNKDVALCGTVIRVGKDAASCVGIKFHNFFSSGHKILREFLRGQAV